MWRCGFVDSLTTRLDIAYTVVVLCSETGNAELHHTYLGRDALQLQLPLRRVDLGVQHARRLELFRVIGDRRAAARLRHERLSQKSLPPHTHTHAARVTGSREQTQDWA